ncbi:MAG: HEAT repeat domain-containing protein [Gemmatimonadales bacterium]
MRSLFLAIVALGGAGGIAARAAQQDPSLARRVESGPDGLVGVSFSSRAEVCGNGFSMLRVSTGSFGDGDWMYSYSNGSGPCEPGPLRVLVRRAAGRVVAVRVGAGAAAWPAGTTDLGSVSSQTAAGYFLELAGRIDGRAGRDALLAGVLADSGAWEPLLEIARNDRVSRGLRESAVSWLGRDPAVATGDPGLVRALLELARNPDLPTGVRTRAVTAAGRSGSGATDALLSLAREDDPALAKAAVTAVGREPDARIRSALERLAADSGRPRAVRTEAVRVLGGRDATPADFAALRRLWPSLSSEQRQAVIRSAGEFGGSEQQEWLTDVVRTEREVAAVRAQAVRAAEQAGVGSAGLARLYDEVPDRKVREAVLEALVRIGDRTARERVARIAETDTDPALRRAAIRRLATLGDQDALEAIVTAPIGQR